jgi:hypothetical protein
MEITDSEDTTSSASRKQASTRRPSVSRRARRLACGRRYRKPESESAERRHCERKEQNFTCHLDGDIPKDMERRG